jgi:quercetin dioxygenase-like cupin family protein
MQQLWFLNTVVTVRVSCVAGEDSISVLESLAPHGDSPPLHVYEEDEIFHVLEGELRVRVGEEDTRAGPGETVLAPKGVPHTYRVDSQDGGRWLVITHGDFERLVRSVGRPAERPGLPPRATPTPEQVAALAEACRGAGIEIVGPPLDS